ncbi:Ferritin heavy chain [Galemys pyrenaicus]|uniref:Ferritin n=1 Tax=Galemys pyrenaicus TaxID=202257 RepID=A0A8J5ZWL2_GALPY|nr:Ferritin heavy chain [Galemys pyrenaicus]
MTAALSGLGSLRGPCHCHHFHRWSSSATLSSVMGLLRGPGRRRLHARRRCPPREPRLRSAYPFVLAPPVPAPPPLVVMPPPPVMVNAQQSQIRLNYHPDCEISVNNLINLELYASYMCLSISFYFDREEMALRHFAEYFQVLSEKENDNAEKLMEFQILRGGRLRLRDIKKPDRDNWQSGLKALKCALYLKKTINQNLIDLYNLATSKSDPHLCDFLETYHLDQQVRAMKELGEHLTNLLDLEDAMLADFCFDKLTLGENNMD